jgi:hypothetical protein
MDDPGEYLRSVVRVFPDYADSVIWFAPGPVPYEEAHVSTELRDAMIAWEQAWYDGLSDGFHFSSPAVSHSLAVEGHRLATLLSDELGDNFEVEFRSDEVDAGDRRRRGSGSGTNPAAVAAFRRMADDDKAEHDQIQAMIAAGAQFRLIGNRDPDSSADGT